MIPAYQAVLEQLNKSNAGQGKMAVFQEELKEIHTSHKHFMRL
jgi:hypothetical protein